MNDYIKEYKNSLTPEFCKHVIDVFENETKIYEGKVSGGVVIPHIKKTMDYHIHWSKEKDDNWLQIEKKLFEELQPKLLLYIKNLDASRLPNNMFEIINTLTDKGFLVHRYIAKNGKYMYHHDGLNEWETQSSRVLTFLWYLNDVSEGGETEFFGNYKIKPEAGKLVFFPANWCFPHCGCMPISSNKYIITGWLSVNENKEVIKQITKKLIDDKMKQELYSMKNELDTLLGNINEEVNATNVGFIDEVVDTEENPRSYGRIYKTRC